MRKNKGFTLVEILIVVIILGILAAIVIPQFTNASEEARGSQISSDIQTLRSQLELYRVQHLERYPNIAADGTADADPANFVLRLTQRTTDAGAIDAAGPRGPYLQAFPTNPYTQSNAVKFGVAGTDTDASVGWIFDTATGRIAPSDEDHKGL